MTYIRQQDILPRLRDLQPGYGNVVRDAIEAIETRDAEIEQLRAALQRIIILRDISSFRAPCADKMAEEAATALADQQSAKRAK